MYPEATETLKATLAEVNPYFQEHLESDFEDENRRRSKLPHNFNDIPSVFSVDGNKTTLLKGLKIAQPPNFIKRLFEVRMEQLYIDVALTLEELIVEGEYEVFNNDVRNVTASEESGNITFTFDNTMIEGPIPIYVVEDSFVAHEDFVLSFKPTQINIKKSRKINGKVETSEAVKSERDSALVKSFWPGLLDTISYILFREIGGPIVEYSVSELFADEPEEMIDLSNKRVELANKLCSMVLEKAKKLPNKDHFEVPDFNLTFKRQQSTTPSCISFKKGKLSNLLNIRKHKNFSINKGTDKTLYLIGGLEVREITLSYDDCSAKHDNVDSQGSCKLSLYRTKLAFKASIRKLGESYAMKLENINICWVRDIDYDVTGLDCLSNIQDDIKSYVLSYFQGEIVGELTRHLEDIFGGVVKDCDVGQAIFSFK